MNHCIICGNNIPDNVQNCFDAGYGNCLTEDQIHIHRENTLNLPENIAKIMKYDIICPHDDDMLCDKRLKTIIEITQTGYNDCTQNTHQKPLQEILYEARVIMNNRISGLKDSSNSNKSRTNILALIEEAYDLGKVNGPMGKYIPDKY